MADILIRGLDERTVRRLKDRARKNRRSLQGEAKVLLENGVGVTMAEFLESARAIRKRIGRKFDDGAELIRRDRER